MLTKFQIKPHQLSPLLATPRSLACLFAGCAFYVGYIDPSVRQLLPIRQQLSHWVGMFKPSIKVMGSLAIVGSLFSLGAYFKTKVNLWLIGGALMLSLWPYTLLTLKPINDYLLTKNQEIKQNIQMTSSQKFVIQEKLDSWVQRHKGRIFISIVAAVVFYFAELKSTEKIDLGIVAK